MIECRGKLQQNTTKLFHLDDSVEPAILFNGLPKYSVGPGPFNTLYEVPAKF